MTMNVGSVDRIIRGLLGIALLGAPFVSNASMFNNDIVSTLSIIAGMILVAVAIFRVCPIYKIFGLSTL